MGMLCWGLPEPQGVQPHPPASPLLGASESGRRPPHTPASKLAADSHLQTKKNESHTLGLSKNGIWDQTEPAHLKNQSKKEHEQICQGPETASLLLGKLQLICYQDFRVLLQKQLFPVLHQVWPKLTDMDASKLSLPQAQCNKTTAFWTALLGCLKLQPRISQ